MYTFHIRRFTIHSHESSTHYNECHYLDFEVVISFFSGFTPNSSRSSADFCRILRIQPVGNRPHEFQPAEISPLLSSRLEFGGIGWSNSRHLLRHPGGSGVGGAHRRRRNPICQIAELATSQVDTIFVSSKVCGGHRVINSALLSPPCFSD